MCELTVGHETTKEFESNFPSKCLKVAEYLNFNMGWVFFVKRFLDKLKTCFVRQL